MGKGKGNMGKWNMWVAVMGMGDMGMGVGAGDVEGEYRDEGDGIGVWPVFKRVTFLKTWFLRKVTLLKIPFNAQKCPEMP
jgi:hypothetical protein